MWIFLLPVALGVPFVGRAYFVDDHYHMLMARGLLDHPLRPYDFKADDDGVDNLGWERGRPPRMVNPPVHHYLLASFWKLSGGRLALVRFLSLFVSGGTALFLFFLAKRFAVPPRPAAVLACVSPAFWLSSYGLLIDSSLLFFFLGGLWAWTEGLERRSAPWLAAAASAMGLAILTKYTGGFVVPLAGLYWVMLGPRPRRWRDLLFLLIPVGVLGAWSLWNIATYGAPHLTESSKRVMQSFAWSHVLIFLTFFTGVLVVPFEGWPVRGGTPAGWVWLIAFLGLGVFLNLGGFTVFQAFFMAALTVAGAGFLFRATALAFRSPYPGDRFLWLWLLVGSVQMVYVMQWVAGRYYLTLLPPVVFLFLRSLQGRFPHRPRGFSRAVTAAVLLAAVVGGSMAAADWAQAQTARRIAADARRDGWLAAGRRGFFLGDSFTGSYLKYDGWRPAFADTEIRPGDLILHQEIIMPRWWFRPQRLSLRAVKIYSYPWRFPVRVMDNAGSAGFYASAWGALPMTLSRSPLERYTLLEVVSDGKTR